MSMPPAHSTPRTRRETSRIDTERLRQQHPIADVVRRYGVELRRSGSSFTGRCPFHVDQGRPNFVVFPRSERWWCFRCGAGGDVITFVQELEHVSFREAAARLGADPSRSLARRRRPEGPPRRVRPPAPALDADAQAVLDAAVELYANRLLIDDAALAYMAGRGFPRALLEHERVGYAAGDELARYLLWRRLPPDAARRTGLLRAHGREYLAGPILFPEIRAGRTIWLIGRVLDRPSSETTTAVPRYLGLPGRKPLLGWEAA